MNVKKILITGASIAGPTLAYWLNEHGFEVTVVERAPELRLGGQNIDVKGSAQEIARRMGLEEEIRNKNTTEVGLRFVTTQNKLVTEFPKESSLSMTQELEILRGDLVKILYDRTKRAVNYRFGQYITALRQTEDEVTATFSSGNEEFFDLLVIAEGIGSQTRKLVFGNKVKFKYLGLYTAYLTMSKSETDSKWARWCNAVCGIVYLIRPDNYGTTRGSVTFTAEEHQYNNLSLDEQKKALIQRIKGSDWESERFIKEIEKSEDLYFERVSQVKSPVWSSGRVIMIGDAAYCATPIAGKGTDLAMTGAYLLAGELARASTYKEAFLNYEKKMMPYVEICQKLPPGIPWIIYPKTKLGISVLNTLFSVAGSKPAQWLIGLFTGNKKEPQPDIVLPDYKK